jgi:diguanylate cyclase (GGDEF)-like protein
VLVHDGTSLLFANAAAALLLDAPNEAQLARRSVSEFEAPAAPGAFAVAPEGGALPGAGSAGAAMTRTRVQSATGRVLDVEVTKSACRYNDRPAAVVILRDIADELRREQELRAMADADELTGIANRRGFLRRAGAALDAARAAGRGARLVFADVDRLKQINDTHGHAAGDAAIRATARALSRVVDASDVVARLGGDEFVALALDAASGPGRGEPDEDAPDARAAALAARFADALREEAVEAGAPCAVSASVGSCRIRLDRGEPTHELLTRALAHADGELYRSKAAHPPRGTSLTG